MGIYTYTQIQTHVGGCAHVHMSVHIVCVHIYQYMHICGEAEEDAIGQVW